MAAIAPWVCITCHTTVSTRHCPDCGEEAIDARDLGLRHLLVEAFHSVTNVDSRLIRSFRALLFRPGALTSAYVRGPRKPYISPVQLFLIVNVVFFAVQSITRTKVFSSPLASHLNGQDWSALARSMVANRLAHTHMTLETYAPLFDQAVTVNARAFVFVMALPFALLLAPLFWGSKRPFATHMVFSLHFYAFQLVLLCALLAVVLVQGWLGGTDIASGGMDTALFVVQLAISALYLYLAIGNVYGTRGVRRIATVAVLIIAVACVVLGYRFFTFVITLYSTAKA